MSDIDLRIKCLEIALQWGKGELLESAESLYEFVTENYSPYPEHDCLAHELGRNDIKPSASDLLGMSKEKMKQTLEMLKRLEASY